MSLNSMTGYGRSTGALDDVNWQWELRSVNGKGLDIKVRMPQNLDVVEQRCRKHAQSQLNRGNIQCNFLLKTGERKPSLKINEEALKQALMFVAEVEKAADVSPASSTDILNLPGVLERITEEPDEDQNKALHAAIVAGFEEAVAELRQSRAEEGKHLHVVLARLIDDIDRLTLEAKNNPWRSSAAIEERINKHLKVLIGADAELDPQRLHQEAMLIASKSDIQEELDRLMAHIVSARELINTVGPVGRKLDFLCQEFNREANTLCSKSNSVALTKTGLALKACIEQLREQIQNVE